MRMLCARDEALARLLCESLEDLTAELPLADRAMEIMSWKESRCRWTESLMTAILPGDPKRLLATVRAALSQGPAEAKRFLEDMIQIGEDVYAKCKHRLTQIMQLPVHDWRKAVYAFLRGHTPFCPPAGRVRQLPPWNPYNGIPGNLQAIFQRAPLHALLVSMSYTTHDEAMCPFLSWMATVAQAFGQWFESSVVQDYPTFLKRTSTVSAQSWVTIRGTMVRSSDSQGEPWLEVFANHPAVENVMGWPREVLPVLQQPLCSLSVLAVTTMLDVGVLWLYDRQLQRIIPVAE